MAFSGLAVLLGVTLFFGVRSNFPRPYREQVAASGLDEHLVYALIRTESGFDEKAKSRAGAVGLMQLLPSTAQFICEREKIPYEEARLDEGAYNLRLGCLYLHYLLAKFPATDTALAAYNAGEGVVAEWLQADEFSADGVHLLRIPYRETERYLKKIRKFRKIYDFFY